MEALKIIVAGGTEYPYPMSSDEPGIKSLPIPWLVDHYPDAYLSMGLTAERLAQRFGITREAADEFSLRSHQKALAAIQAGKFADETIPVPVSFTTPNGSKPKRQEIVFKVDEGPRADTSLDALLALKPAFHVKGTVTAGNSSQDVRTARPRLGHVRRSRHSSRHQAAGALRRIRYGRIQTRRNGIGAGVRDSQSA